MVPLSRPLGDLGRPSVYAHNSGPRCIELNRSLHGPSAHRTLDTNLEELFRERGVDEREDLTGNQDLFLETSKLVGPEAGADFDCSNQ